MQSATKKFYGCRCFFGKNYYVPEFDIHVEYHNNEERFMKDFGEALQGKGCTEKKFKEVVEQLGREYARRMTLLTESENRRITISSTYVPLHEEVYHLKESHLSARFLALVRYSKQNDADYDTLVGMMVKEKADKVFRMSVFTKEFCAIFLEEVENFEKSNCPKGRPNTMNHEGILLDELGFNEGLITPLRTEYLDPISRVLFPEWGGGCLDSHKAFTVKYAVERDADLGFHYDNAEVTLNVSLSEGFDDGSLYFGAMRQNGSGSKNYVEVKHTLAEGILHRGQHRHGAMPVTYGERTNLIIWMRASAVRNKLCPMCDREPELFSMAGFGGGFTKKLEVPVEVCTLH